MSAGTRATIELDEHGRLGEMGYYYARAQHDAAKELLAEADKIRADIATQEARLEVIVQELRTLGASWAVVGRALGTTKAAAYKRFAGRELAR